MPEPYCHLNLLLPVPAAERITAVARRHGISTTAATRELMIERLALEETGWDLDDPRRMTALEIVARLNQEEFARLVEFLKDELRLSDSSEEATA